MFRCSNCKKEIDGGGMGNIKTGTEASTEKQKPQRAKRHQQGSI